MYPSPCHSHNLKLTQSRQEDLGLYGNELNYMQTLWTVGYVIGEIPSNMILTRVRPSIWIPTLEVVWTVLTFCTSRCNTAQQLYAVRFFVGLAESGFYPGMQYLIGSWYRKDELAKRSCIFHTCGAIASMFSGYLMAAVYHLEGSGGFRGWQVSNTSHSNKDLLYLVLTPITVALPSRRHNLPPRSPTRLHLPPGHAGKHTGLVPQRRRESLRR